MQLPSEIQMISAELRFGGFPVRWPDLSIVAFIILFVFSHLKHTQNSLQIIIENRYAWPRMPLG